MKLANLIIFLLVFSSFSLMAQGDCSTATVITSVPFSDSKSTCGLGNTYSSANSDGCDEFYMRNGEDYVYEITPSTDMVLVFNLSGAINTLDRGISITESCPDDVSMNCIASEATYDFDNDDVIVNASLTAGITYYILIDTYDPGCTSFDLDISLAPSNDECSGAIVAPVSTIGAGCGTVLPGTVFNSSASADPASCGDGIYQDDDVWYSFTATESMHNVSFQNVVGSDGEVRFTVYEGGCSSLNEVDCGSSGGLGPVELTGVTPGDSYIVRVYSGDFNPSDETFELCISTPTPPPSNDECSNSQMISVNSDVNCLLTTSGSINGATASSQGGCYADDDDDVWFNFTSTSDLHSIEISNIVDNSGSSFDEIRFDVYEASTCADVSIFNSIVCDYDVNSSGAASISGLLVGQNYVVRVYSFGTTPVSVDFDICVSSPPVSNDYCSGATSLATNVPFNDNNSTATGDGYCAGDGSSNSSNQNNRWYTWEAPAGWVPNDSVFFTLIPTSCAGSDGLEYTIYKNTDCSMLEVSPCTYSNVADFINNFGLTSQAHEFEVVPGDNFLINVDGYYSDECSYTIIAATDSCANSIDLTTDGSNCSLSIDVSSNNGPFDIVVTDQSNLVVGTYNNSLGTETITGLLQGDYEVSITNANGCESVVTTTVDCNCTFPEITPLPNQVSCTGDFTFPAINGNNLTSNLAYFTGANGTGTTYQPGDVVSNSNGTFTYYIYDINTVEGGCYDEETFTVDFVLAPTALGGADQILDCTNSTADLDGSLSTGSGTLSYTWTASLGGNITTNELLSTITVDQPGTYTLTVLDLSSNCSSTDDVQVTLDNTPPVADAGIDLEITCSTLTPTLDGSNSTGSGTLSYDWSTSNGTFTSATNTVTTSVDAIGIYTLTITDQSNGCTDTDDVEVTLNNTLPTADAGSDQILTCLATSLTLDGSNSTGSGTLSYDWSTSNGTFTAATNTVTTTVDAIGIYTLTITDQSNGCTDTDDVEVTLNNTLPTADAGSDQVLSCLITTLTLDGSSSTGNGTLSYSWSTLDGNIQSGNLLSTATVDAIGTYTLTVTDASNGCTHTDDVLVTTNSNLPTANAGVTQELNCLDLTLSLDGTSSSSGSTIEYLWTTSNGNITSGATTSTAVVDQPGTYNLRVTDNSNGCSSNSSVDVTQNNTIPTVDIAPVGILNCNNLTLTLDGSLSSQSSDIDYLWTTSIGGNIVSGSVTNTAIIDQPADYTLTVNDQSNGCSAFEVVTITENISTPVSSAGSDKVITCSSSSVVLDGSNSTSGASIDYLWSTSDGNILSGATTNSCTVDAIGTYTLRVTNTISGCYTEDNVVVTQNSNIPTADAGGNRILDCTNTLITLDGSASSSSSTITYTWSGGPIVSGGTTNRARINTAGTYTLTVSDASNGCSSTSDAIVTQNITSPIAEAGTGAQLSCVLTSTALDGTGSSVGANYTYTWTGGNIVSGGTTLNPVVDQANTYVITVTDNTNGCTATDNVIITQDASVPVADAGSNEEITCSVTNFTLGGSTSSTGASIDYLWSTSDGTIDSDPTLAMIDVTTPGTYLLTVSDNSSGCSSSDNVVVSLNNTLPVADAGTGGVLTCSILNLQLDGSASDIGATINYAWSTSDGNMTSATNLSTVSIDQAGTYTLTVSNTDNGCSAFDDVVVTQNNASPIADAGTNSQLDCLNSSYVIGGTSSTGPSITYDWTTSDGVFDSGVSSSNPTVSTPGTYDLVVTDTDNDCFAVSQVVITEDLTYPIANAGSTNELNCNVTSLTIGDVSTSSGSNFTYLWTVGSLGNITSNTNSLTATVDAAGTYTLRVTNDDNGCFSTSSVIITSNTTLPIANAGGDKVLDCDNLSVNLDGLSSSSGTNYTYSWTTSDGVITSGGSTNNALTSTAGTYTLTVTNSLNGCSETDDVIVSDNVVYPIADAGTTYELTCTSPTYNLDGSASDSGLDYLWTTLDGQIVSGSTTLSPLVDAPGTYTLEVTNNSNGCQSTNSVIITNNSTLPIANAGGIREINCDNPSVDLDGSLSSAGVNYTYTWTGGTISSGATTLTPTVSSAGTYQLLVENTVNGCQASAQVDVTENLILPVVDAGNGPVILDCNNLSNTLSGSGDSGVNYSTTWSTTSGNIVSGQNTFTPTVDQQGSYVLTITNFINGCSNSDNVVVVQNNTLPIAEAGQGDEIFCIPSYVDLDGTGSSTGTGIRYSWSGPVNGIVSDGNTLSPRVEIGGVYTLKVTNTVNGCEAFDNVTIDENNTIPTVSVLTPNIISCDNPNVILDGSGSDSGLDYSWTTLDGNILSGQLSNTINVDLAGTYTLKISNSLNSCENSVSVLVTGDLSTLNLVVTPATPTCENDTVLDLSPFVNIQGGEYVGSGITSPTSSIMDLTIGAGMYAVDYTVFNPVNNCPVTEQIAVEVLSNPIINFSSNVTEGCLPLQVTLTDDNPEVADACVWNFGDGNESTSCGVTSNTYNTSSCFDVSLTKTFANGCSTTGTLTDYICVNPLPVSDFIADNNKINSLNTKVLFSNYSVDAVDYFWNFGDDEEVEDPNQINPEHIFPEIEAVYNVSLIAISDKGCRDTSLVQIKVTEEEIYYIPNSFTPNGDNLNPEFKPIFSTGVSLQDYSMYIFNRWGQIVFESHDIEQGWDGAFGPNGEILSGGTFIWTITIKAKDSDTIKQVSGEVHLIK